jgi:UDP-N-acetylglucosamine--N-acetylmuramyl-(pentapeptide) pyrophosphoryl-undecaprenol N-acetylglucosamine transferase
VNVVIAGGGTAGHVFPAIALADELVADAADATVVTFVGSPDGQEATIVPAAGYRFQAVAAEPLRREFSMRTAKAPFIALGSVRTCLPLVRQADVVVGVGGYASVPAVLAARWSGRPIVLHEQNAVPSLANRSLARLARSIAVSFERSRAAFPGRVPIEVTGNPVRASITQVLAHRDRLATEAWGTFDLEPDRTTVAMFGGSLGALHLDQVVAGALSHLRDRTDLQLLVLTGPAHVEVVAGAAAADMPLRVRVLPYLERMDLALAITDLAVARAGAGHIAELTVCGVPSILVPYPYATEDHQEANARVLVDAGAAELYLDAELSPQGLASRILDVVGDPDRMRRMARAAGAWGRPDAAGRLAGLVRQVASR